MDEDECPWIEISLRTKSQNLYHCPNAPRKVAIPRNWEKASLFYYSKTPIYCTLIYRKPQIPIYRTSKRSSMLRNYSTTPVYGDVILH